MARHEQCRANGALWAAELPPPPHELSHWADTVFVIAAGCRDRAAPPESPVVSLWARSAAIALAFTVFASALLWTAPAWSQSQSTPVVTFAATIATTTEGGDDVELQIGVPQGHVGLPVEIDLNISGTAQLGTDYTLVSLEATGSVSIDETTSGVTLSLAAVPGTPLRLLLQPRANDAIRQGDRRAELRISGYRVAGVARNAEALPAPLGVTILDRSLPGVMSTPVVTFAVTTDTTTEGGADIELRIGLPQEHVGMSVEIELTVLGTALAGPDYTLVAADSMQGIMFGDRAASPLMLSVDPAPAELRLLLRPRGDDRISQGPRFLNLRISGYRVVPESTGGTVDLPAALDLTIADDEPPLVQQLQTVGNVTCVLLNDGSVRCVGLNALDVRVTRLPGDLGPVTQLAVGSQHVCAVTDSGQVRCWGANGPGFRQDPDGRATPPDAQHPDGVLGPVAQIGAGDRHSCALTVGGKLRCWGNDDNSRVTGRPADDLGPVTQLAVGENHSCALTDSGQVHCWGADFSGQSSAPAGLDPVAQLVVSVFYSCVLTVSGQVRCWGAAPGLLLQDDLGSVAQLLVGAFHSCVLTFMGELLCRGSVIDVSSLPPGAVTTIATSGHCALLADGSVYCPEVSGLEPPGLATGDAVMGVWPRQLQSGERAAIRFVNLRKATQVFETTSVLTAQGTTSVLTAQGTTSVLTAGETTSVLTVQFTAQFEVFGDGTAEPGRDYRLLDSDEKPLVAESDGSYLIEAGLAPMAWLEVLVARSLLLYVRPLKLQPTDGSELSIRQVAQRVELMATATDTLARLRVLVPAGNVLQLPADADTITVDVRVEVLDVRGLPIDTAGLPIAAPGLLLVAELLTDSAGASVDSPAALSATDETGVFEGRLTVALDEDDTAVELRIEVTGFTDTEGIIIQTAVVRVWPALSFVAAASTTTEGADDVELQIGVPQGHVGRPVDIDLNIGGTALLGTDYTLVSETPGSVSIAETDSGVTLQLAAVPGTPLRLLLQPRANDIIRQGDRRAELRISGYRVDDEARSADALPAPLGVTILDPYLPVRQRLLGVARGAACVLLDEQDDDLVELRCWTANSAAAELRTVLAADDILNARQLAFGEQHVCWLQQDRQVVCKGSPSGGQTTIPAALSTMPTVAVVAGREGSCAVDEDGAVRCWGRNGAEQSALPAGLRVTQLSLGDGHGCALHADGAVSCWGDNTNGQATPPDNLDPVLWLALGYEHSCALQRDGQLRCWGANMPPDNVGLATQLTSGANHSCALLEDGTVRCWGASDSGQLIVPSLPPGGVKSLAAGGKSSCALLADGSVRCWGGGLESAVPAELQPGDVAVSVLPQRLPAGEQAAIRFADLRGDREAPAVRIELLDGTARFGIDYRLLDAAGQPVSAAPDGRYRLAGDMQPAAYIEALPDPQGRLLRTLYVLPLETVPTDGSALSLRRAAQPVELTAALAMLRVSLPAGNVLQLPASTDTITVDVRVAALDTLGLPIAVTGLLLVAERVAGSARYWLPSVAMPAALSATGETGVFEGQLMVALDEADTAVELRIGVIGFAEAQGIIVETAVVRVLRALSFSAAASMTSEGADGVELQIRVPQEHVGRRMEIELTGSGTAILGVDYSLMAVDPAQGIMLGDGSNSPLTLSVDPAPAEPLRLLLRPRGDDRISQDLRLLNLRISSYRVVPESAGTVGLPPVLNLTIVDDEPPTVQQLQFSTLGGLSACVRLSDGSLRCAGNNLSGRATPPDDLGLVTQLAVGGFHACAVTVLGRVDCWGNNFNGQAPSRAGLEQVVQLAASSRHNCALTALGTVHCWGEGTAGKTSPPGSLLGPGGELGPVAEIGVGDNHSCALTVGGAVRCWGNIQNDPSLDDQGPVRQLAVGENHSCALTMSGQVHCWGSNGSGRSEPPDDLDQVGQIGVGDSHSCALTMSGQVHCWGADGDGQSSPPAGLGPDGALVPAAQLAVGNNHSCAQAFTGQLHCWGSVIDVSSLPPGSVTTVDASGRCALLVDGSLYCPGDPVSFPSELRSGGGLMAVWPRQLRLGERAAIRFANLRNDKEFTAQFEVFGDDTVDVSSAYRLLDSDGTTPLVAESDGSYELDGGVAPMVWLESLVTDRPLLLYVRPLELQPTDGSQLSIRQVVQPVELTTATATLARLRVSVPAGNVLQLPAGTDTITVDVRVEALDTMGLPIAAMDLLLVAELLTGSARDWLPRADMPEALSATDETGVFEGQLMVALDEEDTAVELSIRVIGFAEGEGVIVETAVVQVLQSLSFIAVASTTTEGADGVELQIGLPQGPVDMSLEIDLSIGGTALYDSDYTLVSETPGSVSIDETTSGVTLRLDAVPDTPLRLLLRPRANDIIRQEDRRAELRISGYRVAGVERNAEALPTALGVTILDRYLPVRQRLLGVASGAACVLLDEQDDDLVELRCWTVNSAAAELRTVLAADDILNARQLAFGEQHVCWLQQDRQVVCAGSNSSGQATVPNDLGTTSTVAVVAGREGSCAVDENGAVRCWGRNGAEQSALPADLRPVTQLSLGDGHGCALHADGGVSCWGDNAGNAGDKATPPDDLGLVAQLALGYEHSCALQRDGQLRCWGANGNGQAMQPDELATQLTSGANHSCALLADGTVRCWGANGSGQLNVPSLPPSGVKSLVAGGNSSCALLAEGSVRCWGGGLEGAVPAELQPDDVVVSVLPQRLPAGQQAAIRFADLRGDREAPAVRIELLDGTARFGIDYRLLNAAGEPLSAAPDGRYLLAGDMQPAAYIESLLDPQELQMLRTLYVLPLETVPADGSALSLRRAAQPVELTAALARLRVSVPAGNVLQLPASTDTITVDVRVEALDALGLPLAVTGLLLVAERVAGSARYWLPSVAMPAALSATDEIGVFEGQLMVALDEDDAAVELRIGVIGFAETQGIIVETAVVQILLALSFSAVASMTTEGADGVELQIRVPQEHVGSRVDMVLTGSGTAVRGVDYFISAADPAQGIIVGDGATDEITLRVDPAPAEPLRLLLRPREDDRRRQGERLLNLRISGYRVVPESAGTVGLPPALDLTIADDELPTVRQVQISTRFGVFACVLLNDGSVRCVGEDVGGRTMPPDDLGPVTQLAMADEHVCAVTVLGRVRCWGFTLNDRTRPPGGLGQVVQLAVGIDHNCALTALGAVRCWGSNAFGKSSPPNGLGPVAEIGLGDNHSCALTVGGAVHCWGSNSNSLPNDLGPDGALGRVTQLAVGDFHSCALTMSGQVRCWGNNNNGRASPPADLAQVVEIGVGASHGCARTMSGQVRCWGADDVGQSSPTVGLAQDGALGPVTQLEVGNNHGCARVESGRLHCWGSVIDVSSLPAGVVTAVDASGSCALLADGSLYCPDNRELFPDELRSRDGVMWVLPQRLLAGQRAAIRFANLRETTQGFTAQFEVLGDGAADVSSYYQLLASDGQPLVAESDGSYRLDGGGPDSPQLAGNPPMAWLESLVSDRFLFLYVRPLELLLNDGSELVIRDVAQPVELAFAIKLIVQMHGGAKRLLTTDNMAPVRLRLSLTNIDGSPLDESSVLTARLQGMVSADDATVVPAEPFEITASGIGVTAEVMVMLGASGETTLRFTVLESPPGTVVDLSPTALRITLLSGSEPPINLDVTEDDSVGTEDVILLIQFRNAGRSGILPPALVPRQQRLEDLMPLDVVDLRLDLDGNNTVDMTDLRIILRHLAGLRGAALGEGVQQEQVEALFQPQQVLQPSP